MLNSSAKWSFILACLFLVGPAVSTLTFALRDVDGGHAASLLIGASTAQGMIAGIAAAVVALVVGLLGAFFFSMHTGLGCAGLILAWAGWGLGTFEDFVRRSRDGSSFTLLAIEGLAVVLIAWAIAAVISRAALWREVGAKLPPGVQVPARDHSYQSLLALRSEEGARPVPAALAGVAIGAVATGIVVWIMAATPMRGQTLMAVVLGATAAGMAAQLAAASFRVMLGPLPIILGVGLAALAGPILATVLNGSGPSSIVASVFDGTFSPLGRPLSLEWAAGALLGVPLGLAWGGCVLDLRSVPTT
jgi:hypothetical protein